MEAGVVDAQIVSLFVFYLPTVPQSVFLSFFESEHFDLALLRLLPFAAISKITADQEARKHSMGHKDLKPDQVQKPTA
jgi:hypothetical protein